jgi:hypothetical protein
MLNDQAGFQQIAKGAGRVCGKNQTEEKYAPMVSWLPKLQVEVIVVG